MNPFANLLNDLDCPDCKARGQVYSLNCSRCVARMIAREPPSIGAIRHRKLAEQLDKTGFQQMTKLIAEERELDRKAAA